jgi:hypothetical protein
VSSWFSLGRIARKLERKCRTLAWPIAVSGDSALHFLGRQHATVEAETMAILAGGKAMRKKSRQALRRNSLAIVLDADP